MLKKSYSKTGRSCRVTFKITADRIAAAVGDDAHSVSLVGELNDWNPRSHPLKKRKDGTWSTTVSLDAGRDYRFRYFVDGGYWLNDEEADHEVWNEHGTRDAVIAV